MNILLLNQFYAPDVAPTARYLQDLAAALAARGHAVTVVCSSRAYSDGRPLPAGEAPPPGVTVVRVAGSGFGRGSAWCRALDCLSFGLGVFLRLITRHPRPDVVLALTTPPYVGLLAKLACACRGGRHAHWVMDLYPDVMRAHGMLRAGSAGDRWLSSLTRMQWRGSMLTVVLGEDMASRAAAYRRASADGLLCVPLWASQAPAGGAAAAPLRAARGWAADDFVLMYSGNMGLGHRFAEFLAAADATSREVHVRWVFAGGGPRRPEVEQFVRQHPEARIELLPYASEEDLPAHLSAADVHLVSMEPAWQGCLVPSKLQNVFALGRPVIFVGAAANSIAQWIRESGGGWVVGIDDTAGMLQAVREAREPRERERRGAAAQAYAARHFDRTANCTRMCEALETAWRQPYGGQ
ncbi:MAG: glycosyltransferase family 4 protein [Lentisphaerae bacterium]|nr:glycosyltransferase family 4 protein [Lentisphaerota bacterium]